MKQRTLRKIKWTILTLFFRFVGAVVYAAVRLIEPMVVVRFGVIPSARIGHLASNTELFLRRKTGCPQAIRAYDVLFCVNGPIANRQLVRMIGRRVTTFRRPMAYEFFDRGLKPRVAGSRFEIDLPMNHNEYEEFNRIPPQLTFTPQEEGRGRGILRSMGIRDGDAFVCFHARDHVYLDRTFSYQSRESWSYHDFRDSDIQNYVPAVEWLARQGMWALRMGALVERPMTSAESRVIDYANICRSDFGDIYLSAHCKFFLVGSSGLQYVSTIFNVPIALVNMTPFGHVAALRRNDLFIPKKYWDIKRRRFLTVREIFGIGADFWYQTERFREGGIGLVENTPEEILAVVREMKARIDGTWRPEPDDEALQECYRSLFPRGHISFGFPSRIGAEFLRQNRALLE